MEQPLISVIVPVYKVEQYLDRCVQSIVTQSYDNLEIILVDDGSPDSCGSMCDGWAAKDGRIRVIHKENGGAASARNIGVDQTRTVALHGAVDHTSGGQSEKDRGTGHKGMQKDLQQDGRYTAANLAADPEEVIYPWFLSQNFISCPSEIIVFGKSHTFPRIALYFIIAHSIHLSTAFFATFSDLSLLKPQKTQFYRRERNILLKCTKFIKHPKWFYAI